MRNLDRVEEFRREAKNAMFTKQQAIAVTLNLLDAERCSEKNSEEEMQLLTEAMQKISFRYLDSLSVARLTVEDIAAAIDAVLFECRMA